MFNKIIGQDRVLSSLKKIFGEGAIGGAYLFHGPSSTGKYLTARTLSRYVLCTLDPDDHCRCASCRIFPWTPDYFEISLNGDTIKVSDVDGIENFLSLFPFQSKKRVVVVDDADRMNVPAANRLLKVLEDLRTDSLMILCSSYPEKLPKTILSRLYPVRFDILSTEDISTILKRQGHRIDDVNTLRRMYPYLGGKVLSEFPLYVAGHGRAWEFLGKYASIHDEDIMDVVYDMEANGILEHFVEMLLLYFTDMLKIRYESPDAIFNADHLDKLEGFLSQWRDDVCIIVMDKINDALKMSRNGLNLKLPHELVPALLWGKIYLDKEKKRQESLKNGSKQNSD